MTLRKKTGCPHRRISN